MTGNCSYWLELFVVPMSVLFSEVIIAVECAESVVVSMLVATAAAELTGRVIVSRPGNVLIF